MPALMKPSIQTTPFSGFIADRKPCGEPHVWGLLVHLPLIVYSPLVHPLIAHLLATFWLSSYLGP